MFKKVLQVHQTLNLLTIVLCYLQQRQLRKKHCIIPNLFKKLINYSQSCDHTIPTWILASPKCASTDSCLRLPPDRNQVSSGIPNGLVSSGLYLYTLAILWSSPLLYTCPSQLNLLLFTRAIISGSLSGSPQFSLFSIFLDRLKNVPQYFIFKGYQFLFNFFVSVHTSAL